jgi:predicted nucleic acid-binding protein
MAYLVDTNVFLRLTRHDSLRDVAFDALKRLHTEGLCYTPQVMSEFWNVSTRPVTARGGLGLSLEETDRRARFIERHFKLLPDNLATYQEWRKLVVAHSVAGVRVHDAKLVASMLVHGVGYLLTFNTDDVKRFAAITAVDPRTV